MAAAVRVFSFDVEVSTREDLTKGVLARRVRGSQHAWHRVVIAADTRNEAALLAVLMASAHGWIVTAVHDRI